MLIVTGSTDIGIQTSSPVDKTIAFNTQTESFEEISASEPYSSQYDIIINFNGNLC